MAPAARGPSLRRHPDHAAVTSQPGQGPIPGARVLAEPGDAPGRYASARARKNYAGTSPITRAYADGPAVLIIVSSG
jgi:hypothetical protein